ncbi:PEP-CTERM sorting domain-containing protein [bacterium]|nr:MAG: PEP-CTERM sorting domain-containing protein [bacterium]
MRLPPKKMLSKLVTVAALAVVALTSAQAAFVYGLSTGQDSGIFKIDVSTGGTTLMHSISHAGGLNNNTTNSLAYNSATGDFFYTGADKKLYKVNGSGDTLVGTLSKSAASGTFYNGSFYYVEQSTKNVRRVNVNTFSDTLFSTPTGLGSGSYGDIASKNDGTFLASNSAGFYGGSLASGLTTMSARASNPGSLQLGFYNDAALYGISAGSDQIFSINAATGASTYLNTLTNGSRLFITDVASAQAVPEPASLAALALGAGAFLRRRRKA